MEFKFLLSRHAQSTHNIHKNQVRNSMQQQGNYKETGQYKSIKYDPKLIDLNDIDQIDVSKNKQNYGMQYVGLIISSPLNRCLQTAKNLIQGYQDIQVIVEPLLTSRISSAWSVGRPLKQKFKQYPNYNFDFADLQQTNWCFDLLDKQTKSQYNKNDHSPESILEFISEGHPQPYENIITRTKKFKNKIKNTYLQRSGNKRILILSHSCTLKINLASYINKKGKATSHIQFYHCLPIYITQQYLLNCTLINADESHQQKSQKKQQDHNMIE